MKTIQGCQQEIKEIESYIKSNEDLTDSQIKKEKNKILFIRSIIHYLELTPKEEFLVSEKNRITKLIDDKMSQFDLWKINTAKPQSNPKKLLDVFIIEIGIDDFKKSLKTINYILA